MSSFPASITLAICSKTFLGIYLHLLTPCSWTLVTILVSKQSLSKRNEYGFHSAKSRSMLWDSYCTILIYWVVAHHSRPHWNWNVVNVTDHRWPSWMHIWFCQFGLNLVHKSDLCIVDSKFYFPCSLQPLASWPLARVTHKFPKSIMQSTKKI